MFEVDNQDHEDQQRELLTFFWAMTVLQLALGFSFVVYWQNMVAINNRGNQNQSLPLELL